MTGSSPEELYLMFDPFIIDKEFCDSAPQAAAITAAYSTLAGYTELEAIASLGDAEERRICAAVTYLVRGVAGLTATLESCAGKFSALHEQPVAFGKAFAPSYTEGVYLWFEKSFLLIAPRYEALCKKGFALEDARGLVATFGVLDNPTQICSGISQEAQRLGVGLSNLGAVPVHLGEQQKKLARPSESDEAKPGGVPSTGKRRPGAPKQAAVAKRVDQVRDGIKAGKMPADIMQENGMNKNQYDYASDLVKAENPE